MKNLPYLDTKKMDQFIQQSLAEDVGDGDHSSLACIPKNATSKARLIIKEEGVIAGMDLAKRIFLFIDNSLVINELVKDGDYVKAGTKGLEVEGAVRSILMAERLVLNCMQRMSGIATYTLQLKRQIAHTKAQLLDTRKTTPNFRMFEKWAVAIGGGTNHRFGLYDMIMLKDNHIDYAGGIEKAIRATQDYLKKTDKLLKVEIETRNLDEVKTVLKVGGVDVIMLDNMSYEDMQTAVKIIDNQFLTEASGGITLENIKKVAECGVDYISVGALTHSVKSLDISLKAG